jgi:hypothetical protein
VTIEQTAAQPEDFDSLWALEAGQTPPPPAATPPANSDATPPANGETPPTEAQGVQPAPAGGSEAGATPPQPGATDSTTDNDAWIATLPEDAQQHVRQWQEKNAKAVKDAEDRFNALHGKLAPTQRRVSELERELARQAKTPPQAPTPATPAATAPTEDSFFDSTEWKRYAEDFPSDAKVLRASHEAQVQAHKATRTQLEQRLSSLESRLDQTSQQVASRNVESEVEKLAQAHPDWMEVNASEQFKEWFDGWRATQPKSLRSQFYDGERLKELFNDSEFCIGLLDAYKAQHAPTPTPTTPVPPAANATPPQTDSTQPPRRDPVVAMATAPSVQSRAPMTQTVRLEDLPPEQQFEHVWNSLNN